MDRNELARRLMSTFLEELQEHVETINTSLLELEKQPPRERRSELIRDLFRCVHSLKGASQAVDVELLERVCHTVEDLLSPMRDSGQTLSPEMFALLFKTADAIEEAGMRLGDEQTLVDGPLLTLAAQLENAVPGDPPAGDRGEFSERDNSARDGDRTVATVNRADPATIPSPQSTAVTAVAAPTDSDSSKETPVEARGVNSTRDGVAEQHGSTFSGASIRVPAEKLDALLAQCGELLVARRRVQCRVHDVTDLLESLSALRAQYRDMEQHLRTRFHGHDQPDVTPSRSRPRPSRWVGSAFERANERLAQLEKSAERLAGKMDADGRLLAQICGALDDEVHRVRMLPFAEACAGLERAVRDITKETGKNLELVLEGEDVEVDRSVLEGLKDPLLHLVRNAADHGIETEQERAAAGKPPRARITVSAALHGGRVVVTVTDDGRGFDLDRIRERARRQSLPEPQKEEDLVRMVFLPGFSTAPIVTDISGRGVGLDVVESRIQALHGSVDVSFEPGAATRFTLNVPLTLTTIRCVLVSAGGHTYAIPTTNVQQLVRFDPASVGSLGGRDVLLMGDAPIPLDSLATTLGHAEQRADGTTGKWLAIVLSVGSGRTAFLVDNVTGEQEVLVKNLGPRIRRMRNVSGATLLASGQVALVLNAAQLVRTSTGITTARRQVPHKDAAKANKKGRLLIVEDSVTTRSLIKSILETEGYDVTTAGDGQQAWELLQQQPIDLVVTDVDMPRMNGFELTAAIRDSNRFADLPVILVTARETDEDKARGIQVRADGYLVKRRFDQSNLAETIEQLL